MEELKEALRIEVAIQLALLNADVAGHRDTFADFDLDAAEAAVIPARRHGSGTQGALNKEGTVATLVGTEGTHGYMLRFALGTSGRWDVTMVLVNGQPFALN